MYFQLFKRVRCVWAVCILVALSAGCSLTSPSENGGTGPVPGNLRIVTWNVQALFDGNQAGTEYDEYLNEAGWGSDKFSARVSALSRAIASIDGGPPDILALEEIENSQCLDALAKGELSKYGYGWTYFSKNKGSSLGLGVLSRYPFTETRVHGITWDQQTAPRPVLELWLRPQDTPLVLFVCHWKSKLGGDDQTETLRRASARVILRRIVEIRRDYPKIPGVIMGDLNENHDEFYRRDGKVLSALMPDAPEAAEYARGTSLHVARGTSLQVARGTSLQVAGLYAGSSPTEVGPAKAGTGSTAESTGDFLIISGEKPPSAANFDGLAFYSPWGQELLNGSYYYKNNWETIDHFLLTEQFFDQAGWDFSFCRVLDQEPFVNAKGVPSSYSPRTGQGLSDHLPLMLVLSKQ
ncbi:putative endonuclease/exonuclease/phosphatase family protein [Treponema primitia ZAS-2]|uniref:Putative endonuclease/exonuclease/phosphatase family protein n=1 Tax=Treponema primitia (strain ATCC BAA-887 / DSM 12427 / ZAS-2) TaxID=545694 RepID=F5YKN8_TREPZ|nr:endonuclease/exonuclease/phosphatase family protein [Treponema primitia]AEF85428.1 putative endonuclease/exonuclease/phosphatase family protein [Treponema primitia ZAS-2]